MTTPEAIRAQILALVKEHRTAKFAKKVCNHDKDLAHYAGRVFDAEGIVKTLREVTCDCKAPCLPANRNGLRALLWEVRRLSTESGKNFDQGHGDER